MQFMDEDETLARLQKQPDCATCSGVEFRAFFQDQVAPGGISQPLGSFLDIINTAFTCNICDTLVMALPYARHASRFLQLYDELYLENGNAPGRVRINARASSATSSRNLGELLLFGPREDGELPATLPRQGTFDWIRFPESQSQASTISEPSQWADTMPLTVPYPLGAVNFDMLREAMQQCLVTHGSTCNKYSTSSELESGTRDKHRMPIYLINVHDWRLVLSTTNAQYVALSYVWGNVPMLELKSTNLNSFIQLEGLRRRRDEIPRVIQHAIEITILLGETYLWVDSLCIVQDDAEQKHDQISQMNHVFAAATLTIAALQGNDANTPLRGAFDPTGSEMARHSTVQGITLVPKPRFLSPILSQSVYNTRAWTFQERILSERCLYISENQIFFHCAKLLCDEEGVGNTIDQQVLKPMTEICHFTCDESKTILGPYGKLVEKYTQKVLTFPDDILYAFNGISAELSSIYGETICGIPSWRFFPALLWIHDNKPTRRPVQAGKLFQEFSSTYTLPTWSWAAWLGRVTFPFSEINLYDSGETRNSLDRIWDPTQLDRTPYLDDVAWIYEPLLVLPTVGLAPDLVSQPYLTTTLLGIKVFFSSITEGKGIGALLSFEFGSPLIYDGSGNSCGFFLGPFNPDISSNDTFVLLMCFRNSITPEQLLDLRFPSKLLIDFKKIYQKPRTAPYFSIVMVGVLRGYGKDWVSDKYRDDSSLEALDPQIANLPVIERVSLGIIVDENWAASDPSYGHILLA